MRLCTADNHNLQTCNSLARSAPSIARLVVASLSPLSYGYASILCPKKGTHVNARYVAETDIPILKHIVFCKK